MCTPGSPRLPTCVLMWISFVSAASLQVLVIACMSLCVCACVLPDMNELDTYAAASLLPLDASEAGPGEGSGHIFNVSTYAAATRCP